MKTYPARGAANYPGDVTECVGEFMGPTTYGSMLRAVHATYDPETDMTRVEFETIREDQG